MAGRIETYTHSDKSVPNKGGAMIRANCKTDFAARTDQFITFSREVAKMAFAFGANDWDTLVAAYPEIEDHRKEVADAIGERITVDQIVLMNVADQIETMAA